MAQAKTKNNNLAQQAAARDIKNSLSFDTVVELIHSPKKLFWLNFKTGFIRGFAGVLGAAIAVVLIGFLVAQLGALPYIGNFIKSVEQAIPSSP